MTLQDFGNFSGLNHVMSIGVCAEADTHALFKHLDHRSGADGIAHVGHRVVHDTCICVLKDIKF